MVGIKIVYGEEIKDGELDLALYTGRHCTVGFASHNDAKPASKSRLIARPRN
jgi:hypothetical protein